MATAHLFSLYLSQRTYTQLDLRFLTTFRHSRLSLVCRSATIFCASWVRAVAWPYYRFHAASRTIGLGLYYHRLSIRSPAFYSIFYSLAPFIIAPS